MKNLNDSLFSSKDHTWETPKEFFEYLDSYFNFDLDVCAVQATAKCEKFFSPEEDGLAQNWEGMCWMNPPYGREQIKWIKKAYEEFKNETGKVVCLIPARPDTKVWQDVIFKNASAVCFIKGRLKFGGSKDSAPFPSALVVFNNDISEEQIEALKVLGQTFVMN